MKNVFDTNKKQIIKLQSDCEEIELMRGQRIKIILIDSIFEEDKTQYYDVIDNITVNENDGIWEIFLKDLNEYIPLNEIQEIVVLN